jgi:hypothetical protein
VGVLDWEMARTCTFESLKPSKLFRHTLKDVPRELVTNFDFGRATAAMPRVRELAQLFEGPLFPQEFVAQVQQLIRFLGTNFGKELEQFHQTFRVYFNLSISISQLD